MTTERQQNYDYIAQYWEVLAACAWKEYLAHGRGALVIGAVGDPDDSIYFPAEMMASEPLIRDFARFAEEYNPQTEVVMIFLRPPDSVTAYKGAIPERGTPPELYSRLKLFLDEN